MTTSDPMSQERGSYSAYEQLLIISSNHLIVILVWKILTDIEGKSLRKDRSCFFISPNHKLHKSCLKLPPLLEESL